MMLEQRIGRIDRPKQHKVDLLHIYYANSESQLLRQASRLANLNKKLVGDLATAEGTIDRVADISTLGASIYGDTLFDDAILPGYVSFLQSLVTARKLSQESFQEEQYSQQETSRDLYSQHELLFNEDVTQRIREIGEDYQANPIALGRGSDAPFGLLGLTVEYFGPNGEPVPDRQELIFWNDQTMERDGYGQAIAIAAKTPIVAQTFGSDQLVACAQQVYAKAITVKQQREHLLEKPDALESIKITSERLNKIQQVIRQIEVLPEGMDRKIIKQSLQTLNQWKEKKNVKRLLKIYTDGDASQLSPEAFLTSLIKDTQDLNLMTSEQIQPASIKVSIAAMLLRPHMLVSHMYQQGDESIRLISARRATKTEEQQYRGFFP